MDKLNTLINRIGTLTNLGVLIEDLILDKISETIDAIVEYTENPKPLEYSGFKSVIQFLVNSGYPTDDLTHYQVNSVEDHLMDLLDYTDIEVSEYGVKFRDYPYMSSWVVELLDDVNRSEVVPFTEVLDVFLPIAIKANSFVVDYDPSDYTVYIADSSDDFEYSLDEIETIFTDHYPLSDLFYNHQGKLMVKDKEKALEALKSIWVN